MKTGGFIIADNVLWSGKVTENQKDEETTALDYYNKKELLIEIDGNQKIAEIYDKIKGILENIRD